VTLHDEIWRALPAERRVDRAAHDWALERLGARAGMAVLDLGCGDGALGGRLMAAGARVVGADSSPAALERARAVHPGLELVRVQSDAALPFRDAEFDAVACLHVLEHVRDTQSLVSEVRRVLRPAGLLAATVPYHGRLQNLAIALAGFERHYDPLEPLLRYYTPRSLANLLGELGFERIHVEGAGGPPLLRRTLLASAQRSRMLAER
jgi:ubiquinone/menaquinone biosynthesis C-methylase UbiE